MTNINEEAGMFRHIGWKYYNLAKKKAMEQESSWSGLLISLSIAFFIVLAASQALNLTYETISRAKNKEVVEEKIYYLENIKNINTEAHENINAKYLEISLNKQLV